MVADKRVALNSFRKYLRCKELCFASPEDLKIYLNVTPGSVSMMGLLTCKKHVQFYIDEDLRNAPYVCVHPNRNDATLVITHIEIVRMFAIPSIDVQIVDTIFSI